MKIIIERTEQFVIFQDVFEGNVLTFRRWHREKQNAGVEIKLDDTFAKCCGYSSTDDMIEHTIGEQGKKEIISNWGCLPNWVRVLGDGKIYFVGETFNINGEA